MNDEHSFDPLENVMNEFSKGNFVIVFDAHREEEADFFLLAEFVAPEKINFLLHEACGMICVASGAEILDCLSIPLMTKENSSLHGTNFCIPVDAKEGITTGVSASDRAKTIKLLTQTDTKPSDFVKPGHTFPLRAENDFSVRFGHTEAAVALARKCGKIPAVVICEILNKEGEKANLEEVFKIAAKYNFTVITLENVKRYLL